MWGEGGTRDTEAGWKMEMQEIIAWQPTTNQSLN